MLTALAVLGGFGAGPAAGRPGLDAAPGGLDGQGHHPAGKGAAPSLSRQPRGAAGRRPGPGGRAASGDLCAGGRGVRGGPAGASRPGFWGAACVVLAGAGFAGPGRRERQGLRPAGQGRSARRPQSGQPDRRGGDTQRLSAEGVAKAAVETVAENFSDGVAAPLFYLLIGGAPLGLAYKAINTMDSMVGYKNERYLHFGRAAARLDDAANYIPARLAALLWIAAAALGGFDAKNAWRIWRRDRRCHASPNSAQTESACAGGAGGAAGRARLVFWRILRQTYHRGPGPSGDPRGHPAGGPDAVSGRPAGPGAGAGRPDGGLAFMGAAMSEITLTHGGDWAGFAARYGAEAPLLDFSANVSPLGLAPTAARAMAECAGLCDRYPDPLCRQLSAAIAGGRGHAPGVGAVRQRCGGPDLAGGPGPAPRPGFGDRPHLCGIRVRPGGRGLPDRALFFAAGGGFPAGGRGSWRPSGPGWIWCSSANPITPPV